MVLYRLWKRQFLVLVGCLVQVSHSPCDQIQGQLDPSDVDLTGIMSSSKSVFPSSKSFVARLSNSVISLVHLFFS